MKDSKLLKDAFKEGCSRLHGYLKDGVSEDEEGHAKLSIQTVATYAKLKAVENNEALIGLNVARAMSENTEELKECIQKALPEYVVNN